MTTSRAWHKQAKCFGTPHPEHWDADNIIFPRQAEALCVGCPVRRECRTQAEETFTNSIAAGFEGEWDAQLSTVGVVMDGEVWGM